MYLCLIIKHLSIMKATKNLFLIAILCCFFSCSGGDDLPGSSQPSLGEQIESLEKALCYDGKFVEREFKDLTANNNSFKAVVRQKDYVFSSDGTGSVTSYVLTTQTHKGFTSTEEDFTWSISRTLPLSLKIKIDEMESFSLEEVYVDSEKLSSKSTDWVKEIIISDSWEAKDIQSYSIEHLYPWIRKDETESYTFLTPTILTVRTKNGIARFIRSYKGYSTLGFPQSQKTIYDDKGVQLGFGYIAENIYFRVAPIDHIFYDVSFRENTLDFKTKENNITQYNFYIGHVSEDQELRVIDNLKNYNVE